MLFEPFDESLSSTPLIDRAVKPLDRIASPTAARDEHQGGRTLACRSRGPFHHSFGKACPADEALRLTEVNTVADWRRIGSGVRGMPSIEV
ncbi:hypothetical protein [Mesorhizobium sp. M1163]|uniref:hypothetical protein n=1 Tax=Mesorhizobium sp. M1163 TaxID=2957065 RepID=UPI0033393062